MAANPAGASWGERFPYPSYLAVVVRRSDGQIIKGFLANRDSSPSAPNSLSLSQPTLIIHQELETVTVDAASIESVFFVRSLAGERERHEMKFLDESAAAPALWVRAQCASLELLEGSTENNLDLFRGSGFFLRPADSHSNNLLIYVYKAHLRRLQVMGVQAALRPRESKASARKTATKTGNA
jgi:hypothetical protein